MMIVHGDQIVACVEVKSGIYDIANAMNQLAKIKLTVTDHETKTKFLSKGFDPIDITTCDGDDILFLVVTTIPQHIPVTGTSYSDLQIISQVLFDRSDRWLNELVDLLDFNNLNDNLKILTSCVIHKVFDLMIILRTKMNSQIDPETAASMLGDDLIIV